MTPRTLTSTVVRTCSSVRSTRSWSKATPALLNHAVSAPCATGRLGDGAVRGGVADVLGEPFGGADLRRRPRGALAVEVGHDDPMPAGHHLLGDRAADAARASGHDAARGAHAGSQAVARQPLSVSNKTKVKKLNADLVDGLEGDALKTKSFVYTLTSPAVTEDYVVFQLPGLPAGRYQASFSISAAIAGGPPSCFACVLLTGSGLAVEAPVLAVGVETTGGIWVVSGGGYLDTTAATYRLTCQRSGATSMTIPAVPQFPARVVLTRLDDVTAAGSTGAGSTAPRHRVGP